MPYVLVFEMQKSQETLYWTMEDSFETKGTQRLPNSGLLAVLDVGGHTDHWY
jgi:hypothetical protein